MTDLSPAFDIPNPFLLRAADFDYDAASYGAALKFLSDLAGGTIEEDALKINGGSPQMLVAWQGSDKFRRVYAKCRAAGAAEQVLARERAEREEAATEAGDGGERTVGGQSFVALEDLPVRRGVFSLRPSGASWGSA